VPPGAKKVKAAPHKKGANRPALCGTSSSSANINWVAAGFRPTQAGERRRR
jgi:hypothetical protein